MSEIEGNYKLLESMQREIERLKRGQRDDEVISELNLLIHEIEELKRWIMRLIGARLSEPMKREEGAAKIKIAASELLSNVLSTSRTVNSRIHLSHATIESRDEMEEIARDIATVVEVLRKEVAVM